jgi:hypothetical protein
MANYWDTVNLIVETSRPEEKEWLLRVFENGRMSAADWSLIPIEDAEGRDPAELCTWGYDASDASERWGDVSGVWLCSTDNENVDIGTMVRILMVFQLKFRKTEPIIVTWAHHCSSPRPYSTSGGAAAIFHGEAWWFTPDEAAIEKIKQLGGTPLEER